jgi:SAM-dependent methyltransferase
MKFATEDKNYLEKRKKYSEECGEREMWSLIDHWPLYVGISNLARYMAIADLLRSTLDVPGHIAEFGSWKGSNLLFMTKLMEIYDQRGSKVIHCFDSFEGLSTFANEDGESVKTTQGSYAGNYDELINMVELYNLQDVLNIHKGLIQDTLVPMLNDDKSMTFSLIYCDTDLFEPTELILNSMHERLAKGGLFIFDQWNYAKWPGEGVAANKFMKEHTNDYEMIHIRNTRQPSMALRKIQF